MIWGTGFTGAEALAYYQHWCSPPAGDPAALDGSNCNHHGDGFATFQADKTDFGGMTGSEKVIFADGYIADLAGNAGDTLMGNDLVEYKDSVDYVTTVLGCTRTIGAIHGNCDANTTPMSFEFKFTAFSAFDVTALIDFLKPGEEGFEFHLSPERGSGGTQVPEPGTLALLGLGIAGLGFARKRLH